MVDLRCPPVRRSTNQVLVCKFILVTSNRSSSITTAKGTGGREAGTVRVYVYFVAVVRDDVANGFGR